MLKTRPRPYTAELEAQLAEKSALLTQAQAMTDLGLESTARPLWAAAGAEEERIAPLMDALGREAEAALHRISAGSCLIKSGDLGRAANLLRAALAGPLPEAARKEVEQMLAHAAALSTEARRVYAAAFVLCVLFPADQLRVLPFHRLVRRNLDDDALRGILAEAGVELRPLEEPSEVTEPYHYLVTSAGRWWAVDLTGNDRAMRSVDDPVAALDMRVANTRLVAPLLEGGDPQDDDRVEPVAAPLGLEALVRP